MKIESKYGVQKYASFDEPLDTRTYAGGGGSGTHSRKTQYAYYYIKWCDTLEEAVANANGQPIIKSVAYGVNEEE